jgi:hypothetical protein
MGQDSHPTLGGAQGLVARELDEPEAITIAHRVVPDGDLLPPPERHAQAFEARKISRGLMQDE